MNVMLANGPILENVLGWVGASLLYGTIAALFTASVLALFRKRISPVVAGLFWMVVLVKFLVPTGPSSAYSLASIIDRVSGRAAPSAAVGAEHSTPALTDLVQIIVVNAIASPTATSSGADLAGEGPRWTSMALAGLAYLLAVGGIAAWRLATYARFARDCRRLARVDDDIRQIVERVCVIHGLTRAPDVRISADVTAPFILGGLRPLLVLSPRQCADRDELETVVLHEVAHLRRRDLIVRYVQWFAGTLLFFWPVVAWVNRRIDLAREHACDDWALRHGRLSAGQYARCLLRALHPADSTRLAYRPASMARNIKSVERRIEMILDTPRQRSIRSLSVPALVVLAGWSVFALAGARAADDPPKGDSTAQKDDTKKDSTTTTVTKQVKVIAVGGDEGVGLAGGPMDVKVVKNDKGEMEVQINGKVVHTLKDGDAKDFHGAFGHVAFAGAGMDTMEFVSEEDLKQFAKDHPTADANADGKVSRTERSAFLAALAQSNPAAVIAQFPKADLNKDGTLDANEAARLVSDDAMEVEEFNEPVPAPGQGMAVAGHKMMVFRREINVSDKGDGVAAGPTEPAKDAEGGNVAWWQAARTQRGAGKWLLENVKSTPSAVDVARLVPAVEEAPLVRYAEMFPDADTNKDGKVSADERKAHMDKQMSDVRARMLKRHPEADTDGDGKLSAEEERAFFHKNAMRAMGKIGSNGNIKNADGDILIETLDDDDGDTEVTVEKDGNVIKSGQSKIIIKTVEEKTSGGEGK